MSEQPKASDHFARSRAYVALSGTLKPNAFRVLMAMECCWADSYTGIAYPSNEKIAVAAGFISPRPADDAPEGERVTWKKTMENVSSKIRIAKRELQEKGLLELLSGKTGGMTADGVGISSKFRLKMPQVLAVCNPGPIQTWRADSDRVGHPGQIGPDTRAKSAGTPPPNQPPKLLSELLNERINTTASENPELFQAGTTPTKPEKIHLDTTSWKWEGITPELISRWAKAYPHIDVPQQLERAALWCQANPKNRKSNYAKFLVNWFARQRDGTSAAGGGKANGSAGGTGYHPKPTGLRGHQMHNPDVPDTVHYVG